jgi:hypothetical protein
MSAITFPPGSMHDVQSRPGGYHVGVLTEASGRCRETAHRRSPGEAWLELMNCVSGQALWRTDLDAMERILYGTIGQSYLGTGWPGPLRDDWREFARSTLAPPADRSAFLSLLRRLLDDMPVAAERIRTGIEASGPILADLEARGQLNPSTLAPPVEMFVRSLTDAQTLYAVQAIALGIVRVTTAPTGAATLEFRPSLPLVATDAMNDAWSSEPALHRDHAHWRDQLLDEWAGGADRAEDARYFSLGLGGPPWPRARALDILRATFFECRHVVTLADRARITAGALGYPVNCAPISVPLLH